MSKRPSPCSPAEEKKKEPSKRTKLSSATPLPLSTEQQAILVAVVQDRKSLFFTGPPGTGKSEVIGAISSQARAAGLVCAVAAPTGAASSNLRCRSTTLHQLLGCGVPKQQTFEGYWARMRKNRSARRRLRELDLLVLDELSMIHGRLLLILDCLCRAVRGEHDLPFGGIQLVLTGDFLQLPCVVVADQEPWGLVFAFEVFSLFQGLGLARFDLTKIFRQAEDEAFMEMLGHARVGRNRARDRALLEQCKKTEFPLGVVPTKLFTRNKDVDLENQRQLASVPNTGRTKRLCYRGSIALAKDLGRGKPLLPLAIKGKRMQELQRRALIDTGFSSRDQVVRVGMEVMIRKNLDPKLANGTRGRVIGWVPRTIFGDGPYTFREVTLADFEAITVGDLPDDAVASTYRPVVEISRTGELYVFSEHRFEIDLGQGTILIFYRLPFVPAWALTIHKGQGATLDSLVAHFAHTPWPAAAYVALSRVRTLASLRISGDLPAKLFTANKKAVALFGSGRNPEEFGLPYAWPELGEDSVVRKCYGEWLKQARRIKLRS